MLCLLFSIKAAGACIQLHEAKVEQSAAQIEAYERFKQKHIQACKELQKELDVIRERIGPLEKEVYILYSTTTCSNINSNEWLCIEDLMKY